MKRINTRRIKAKFSYDIPQLAALVGAHPNTIHRWIKNEGLPRLEGIYPYMLYGQVVIEFLKARQLKNKITLSMDEFGCRKCKAVRRARDGIATLHSHTSKTSLLKATCERCTGKMCKIISLKNIAEIEKIFAIHTLQPSALVQSLNTNPNCETKGAYQHD